MNPELPILAWSLAAPLLLGILLLRSLGLRCAAAGMSYPGWAWVLGCLYLALGLFVYQCLGLGPSNWWTAPILLAVPPGLLCLRPSSALDASAANLASPWPARLFVGLLLLLTLASVLGAGSLLVLETDEATIWAAKAKLMFLSEGFDAGFSARVGELPHADYPLLNPLLQAWMFSQAGEILHLANRLPILIFALALISIAAGAVLRTIRPIYACLLLLLLVDCEVFRGLSQRAYSDLMVGTGCLMALDGWLRWRESSRPAFAAIACAGMALALWSKNDALLFLVAAIFSLLLLCFRRRSLAICPRSPWLALPFGILLLQWVFNQSFGLSNDLLGDNPQGDSLAILVFQQFGERIGPIASYTWEHGVNSSATQGIYLVFVGALILLPLRTLAGALFLPTATLAFSLIGCCLVYIGSYQELIWHLDTSAGRLLFQMTPFAFLWLALVLRRNAPGINAC